LAAALCCTFGRMRLTALLLASLLALTACGGSSDAESSPRSTGEAGAGEEPSAPTVEILESGFGQREDSVQGIAIVTTDDEAAVGEFVTVSMNFVDKTGAILATEEQVESFNWVGQKLVLPVTLYLDTPGTVASVEASASLSDYGIPTEALAPLPTLEATQVGKGEYGTVAAAFELTNQTDADLTDLRVGVVCRDAGGTIVGGASDYPSLVAAGQTIRLDVDVTTSGVPDACTAYPNYDV
jgi:hypothetical protein